MPGGRSDEALALGDLVLKMVPRLKVGDVAPSFEIQSIGGEPLKLSDFRGKYVLLVGENNIVEHRYVELGLPQDEGMIHVEKGLEGNETLIVNGLMIARPGRPVTPLTPEQFVRINRNYFERGGYFEEEVHRRLDAFRSIAHVFSTYASFREGETDPFVRGINSFQLLRDKNRWWIVSIYWDAETAEQPIPDVYLP